MATAQLGTLLRHIHQLAAGPGTPPPDRQLLEDFAARRDEAAFAALVARHGPMVLRVCRRVLGHEQDAEDAFQATFLVLARNAGSIHKRESLAAWLHGVAFRAALKARRSAARRRSHETRLEIRAPRETAGPSWDDVQAVLDEEIQCLPVAFRTAFVLCVLEGKSGPEAAAELGVKEGTVSSRLTRARQRLRQRLVRRGIELSVLLSALSVAESAGQAAVPAALAGMTLRCGLLVAAGQPAAGVIPTHVAALAAGVTRAMFLTKAKIVTIVLLAAGALAAGAGTFAPAETATGGAPEPPAAAAKEGPKPSARSQVSGADPKAADAIQVKGRVLDPDGRPVAGAELYQAFWVELIEPNPPPAPRRRGTSGPDGRFHFTVRKAELTANPQAVLQVAAVAKGFGPGWVRLDKPGTEDLTVRLAKDDVPISGRILDLEARPIRGATIQPMVLMTTPQEDLTPWFQAIKDKKRFLHKDLLTKQLSGFPQAIPGLPQTITTDADGRFRLTGVGRERVLVVMIGGPKVQMDLAILLTRPVPKFQVFDNPVSDITFPAYGASFEHVAAPAKPLAGTVRDKDTGKPLAGVKVSVDGGPLARAVTDQEGKYQLSSLPYDARGPAGFGLPLLAVPPADQPYLMGFREVKRGPGLDTTAVDFALKRGVWVEGKVTDQATGKPIRAHILYRPAPDNPHHNDFPDLRRFSSLATDLYVTRADGTFRVPALPGPGSLTARAAYGEYLRDGSANVDVTPDGKPGWYEMVLDPGRTLQGTILDPDGKPLAGVRVLNLKPRHFWSKPLSTGSFTLTAVDPMGSRFLLFLHEERRLAKAITLRGSEPGPLSIRLEPAATITGRLVDADGQPRPGVRFLIFLERPDNGSNSGYYPERVKADEDGRFRVVGLAGGQRYQIIETGKPPNYNVAIVATGLSVKSGETKDLGDVKARPFRE